MQNAVQKARRLNQTNYIKIVFFYCSILVESFLYYE